MQNQRIVRRWKTNARVFQNHPIYYAGPAKTPDGMPSGSFGPTTAGRMDVYVDEFQAAGGKHDYVNQRKPKQRRNERL